MARQKKNILGDIKIQSFFETDQFKALSISETKAFGSSKMAISSLESEYTPKTMSSWQPSNVNLDFSNPNVTYAINTSNVNAVEEDLACMADSNVWHSELLSQFDYWCYPAKGPYSDSDLLNYAIYNCATGWGPFNGPNWPSLNSMPDTAALSITTPYPPSAINEQILEDCCEYEDEREEEREEEDEEEEEEEEEEEMEDEEEEEEEDDEEEVGEYHDVADEIGNDVPTEVEGEGGYNDIAEEIGNDRPPTYGQDYGVA